MNLSMKTLYKLNLYVTYFTFAQTIFPTLPVPGTGVALSVFFALYVIPPFVLCCTRALSVVCSTLSPGETLSRFQYVLLYVYIIKKAIKLA